MKLTFDFCSTADKEPLMEVASSTNADVTVLSLSGDNSDDRSMTSSTLLESESDPFRAKIEFLKMPNEKPFLTNFAPFRDVDLVLSLGRRNRHLGTLASATPHLRT
jgi:hypothetical protein